MLTGHYLLCGGFVIISFLYAGIHCASGPPVGDAYSPLFSACCGKIAWNGLNGNRHLRCCGMNTLYDSSTQVCCLNKIYPIKCGSVCTLYNEYVDPTKEYLCIQDMKTRPIPADMDPTRASFARCCGDKTIDCEKQLCCSGNVIVDRPGPNIACCNDTSYDRNTQVCCGSTIHVFDPTVPYKKCYKDNYVDMRGKRVCGYGPMASLIDNTKGEAYGCCGNLAWLPRTQVCCQANFKNVVLLKESPNHQSCCGTNATYDRNTNVCCDPKTGLVGIRRRAVDDKCCGGEGYCSFDQVCCKDPTATPTTERAYHKTEGTSCCGIVPFNPQNRGCANGTLSNPAPRGEGFCNGESYSRADCFCCGTSIHPRNDTQATYRCCGNDAYEPGKAICCRAKQVRPIAIADQTLCCADYDAK